MTHQFSYTALLPSSSFHLSVCANRTHWNTSQWQHYPKYLPWPQHTHIKWCELACKTSTIDTMELLTSWDGHGGKTPIHSQWDRACRPRLRFWAQFECLLWLMLNIFPLVSSGMKVPLVSTKASSPTWSASPQPVASPSWFMRMCLTFFSGKINEVLKAGHGLPRMLQTRADTLAPCGGDAGEDRVDRRRAVVVQYV